MRNYVLTVIVIVIVLLVALFVFDNLKSCIRQPDIVIRPRDTTIVVQYNPIRIDTVILRKKPVIIPSEVDSAEVKKILAQKDSLINILNKYLVQETACLDTNLPTSKDTLSLCIDINRHALLSMLYKPAPQKIKIQSEVIEVFKPQPLKWYQKPEYIVPSSVITGIVIGFYGARK